MKPWVAMVSGKKPMNAETQVALQEVCRCAAAHLEALDAPSMVVYDPPIHGRVYSLVEVRYRNGNVETFPPDYHFASDDADPRVLWILDAKGPVYRRILSRVESISLKEVAA